MGDKKYYVYSARTTEAGLALLNKLKDGLGIGWDRLVNDAVCEKYGLDPTVINMPVSDRIKELEAKRAAKEAAEKAKADEKATVKSGKATAPTEAPKSNKKKKAGDKKASRKAALRETPTEASGPGPDDQSGDETTPVEGEFDTGPAAVV